MVYEIINVRLSRSNPSVQWGFKLQQVNKNQLIVVNVEPESLADKAGIKKSDQVQEFFDDALANGIPWAEIAQRLQTANVINMRLKRYVTEPLNLPWALSEGKDSQVIVDHWDKDGRVIGHSDQNTKGYVQSFKTEHLDDQPIGHTTNFNSSSYLSTQVPTPDLPSSKSLQGQKNSTWDRDEGNVQKYFQSMKSSSGVNNHITRFQQSQVVSGSQNTYGGENHVLRQGSLPELPAAHQTMTNTQSRTHPQTHQYNTGYNSSSRITQNQQHLNHSRDVIRSSYQSNPTTNPNPNQSSVSQNIFSYENNNQGYTQSIQSENLLQVDFSRPPLIDTSQWYGNSQFYSSPQPKNHYNQRVAESGPRYGRNTAAGRITNLNNNGQRSQSAAPTVASPRVYYQRNSPRTYRELSPEATVQHLQYKLSPLKMYPEYSHQAADSILVVEDRFPHPNVDIKNRSMNHAQQMKL
uniref:PDZ domain-containing protein n=1 Tax=Ditylenchus dipsaci TaxID=166011 RepID=A0A915EFB3_9BILA